MSETAYLPRLSPKQNTSYSHRHVPTTKIGSVLLPRRAVGTQYPCVLLRLPIVILIIIITAYKLQHISPSPFRSSIYSVFFCSSFISSLDNCCVSAFHYGRYNRAEGEKKETRNLREHQRNNQYMYDKFHWCRPISFAQITDFMLAGISSAT